ncbi:V-type ATP synthase subunit A [Actinoplanes sp. NPDC048967]|uniref:V-type ATP synthase subunit A n=1 Tax=Actinoplanes sp. NPDC048967 TaxID=3155269 RepID=UPI00340FC5E3
MTTGTVRRVNGPLVEADGLTGAAMAELVEIGARRLPAEVVSMRTDASGHGGGTVTLQAYEYTGGVCPGDPVRALGRPISALLGPGLLGGVFDGLLRPLVGAGVWLEPGASRADGSRSWPFDPAVRAGQQVFPGTLLGTVGDGGPVRHKVLVPTGVSGQVQWIADRGGYRADTPVVRVDGSDIAMAHWWPVRRPRPYRERQVVPTPLRTGQRVLDALHPIVKGGTAAVPGGFGTGKTMLLQQVAKWCDADVIVYVGCGERGNEMADVVAEFDRLTDPRTGGRLAERTVVVANTSNMPIMAREASIYTGVTVAEYFRDMGHDALVIADSTSRWAEAVREFASRAGALPAEEGYPAGLASALAAFYERAARVSTLSGSEGSVSIIGAVSPPGGDMTEPVTAGTQRFVRSLWMLDRDLAYARHYPAVAWSGSYSRDADAVGAWYARHGDPGWAARRARMAAVLAEADRLADLAELVGVGALPGHERMVMLAGRLLREGVLQQSALSPHDAYCPPDRSAALIDAVFDVLTAGEERVASGVPATVVEELDFSPLLRARDDTAQDDLAGIRARRDAVLTNVRELT